MKRSTALLLGALVIGLGGTLSPAFVLAQGGAPPPGAPLPPGHPSVGGDDEDDPDEMPPGHGPGGPGGANPHGGSGTAPSIFRAPPDNALDDPAIPRGAVIVTLKDAQDQPLPRAPITLTILHSSVARGDSRESRSGVTDETGQVRFDGLGVGSGTTYRVSTNRGPAEYAVQPFPLGDKMGKRVVLHAYEVSSDLERLPIGTESFIYFTLKEDSIQIEQTFTVLNLGAVTWAADMPMDLPSGWKAFNKQDSMDDARVDELKDRGVALRGSVSPGRHEVSFRYQVPLADEPRQTVKIEMPARLFQAQVLAESSKSMGLEVADFPAAQRTQNRQGKRLLVTERQFPRKEGQQVLAITLTGLPTTGPGRWIAVALAVTALIAGIGYFVKRRDDTFDDETRGDLVEAREALLAEIVALEKAHRSGEIGPKTYAHLRLALFDALARIDGMVEQARKQGRAPRRAEAT